MSILRVWQRNCTPSTPTAKPNVLKTHELAQSWADLIGLACNTALQDSASAARIRKQAMESNVLPQHARFQSQSVESKGLRDGKAIAPPARDMPKLRGRGSARVWSPQAGAKFLESPS